MPYGVGTPFFWYKGESASLPADPHLIGLPRSLSVPVS